ncbi:MAG: nucleotidyltransferase family protein [Bacillota bacterium]
MNKIQSIIDKSINGIEFNLLLHCLRVYLETESPVQLSEYIACQRGAIRWQVFFDLCVMHRVSPVVTKTIIENNATDFPKEIMDKLNQQSTKDQLQAMELAAETIRLVRLLESNGIRVIVLKGAALAVPLYGDVGMRPTHDVDLLINKADVQAAYALVETYGYKSDHDLLSRKFTNKQLAATLKASHHEKFQKERLVVELHWQLKPYLKQDVAFDKLFHDSQLLSLLNIKLHVINTNELFVYLALHGAMHGWCRIRWLLDIALLAKHHPHPSGEITEFANQAIILINSLLSFPTEKTLITQPTLPQLKLTNKTVDYMVNYNEVRSPLFSLKHFKSEYYFYTVFFNRNSLHSFMNVFFLPRPCDFEIVSLPNRFFWLYYPLRPLFWISRAMKGWVKFKINRNN